MFITTKTIIGKEFIRKTEFSILCSNKKESEILADYLNYNNQYNNGKWKLQEGEKYMSYEIDKYDTKPKYKLIKLTPEITVKNNL